MKKVLFYFLLIFNILYTYAQSASGDLVSKDSSQVRLITNNYIPFKLLKSSLKISETYQNIQGSPYIQNTIGTRNIPICKIFDSNMKFLGSALGFYNAYMDEMEISTIDNGLDYYLLKKNSDFLYIRFSNKTYKVYDFDYKPNYFIILSENDTGVCTLLKKEKVYFLKRSSETVSLIEGDEASFMRAKDSYFLKIDNAVFKIPKNKKAFFNLFKEKNELVKKYTKEKNLKLTLEDDLLSIVTYYNSLLK